jgi:hypothetical protein
MHNSNTSEFRGRRIAVQADDKRTPDALVLAAVRRFIDDLGP